MYCVGAIYRKQVVIYQWKKCRGILISDWSLEKFLIIIGRKGEIKSKKDCTDKNTIIFKKHLKKIKTSSILKKL